MLTDVNFPREGDAVIRIEIPRRADGSHNIAAAFAALDRALSVRPEAFAPDIALRDGQPTATGGGLATHHVEPAPDLPPAVEALIESQQEEPPLNGPDSPGEAAP